jgi:collagenase-like PrtC family protease
MLILRKYESFKLNSASLDGVILDIFSLNISNLISIVSSLPKESIYLSCSTLLTNKKLDEAIRIIEVLDVKKVISKDIGLLWALKKKDSHYFVVYNSVITVNNASELLAYDNIDGIFISHTSSQENLKQMVNQTKIKTFLNLKRELYHSIRKQLTNFKEAFGEKELKEPLYLEESQRKNEYYEIVENHNGTLIFDKEDNEEIVNVLSDKLWALIIG